MDQAPVITFNKPTVGTECGIFLQSKEGPVMIESLEGGGVAKNAGLQVGDTVISINGESVTSHTHGTTLLKAAVGEVKIIVTRQPAPVGQQQNKDDVLEKTYQMGGCCLSFWYCGGKDSV